MPTRKIICRVFLATDQLLRMKELTIGARAHLVHNSRLLSNDFFMLSSDFSQNFMVLVNCEADRNITVTQMKSTFTVPFAVMTMTMTMTNEGGDAEPMVYDEGHCKT